MHIHGNDQPFASFLASVLSIINPPDSPPELAFTAPKFYIDDARATLLWFAMSGLSVLVGAGLVTFHRLHFGPSRLFVPLCFSSIVVVGALIKVTFDLGLLNAT
jgi:hypothetical protein